MNVIDLFAGPGGWDVAAHALGMDPLGIEWDAAACATREAAGLRTLRADVAALDPERTLREHFAPNGHGPGVYGVPRPLDGLIASPPCQAFSMAGNGEGRKAMGALMDAITRLGRPGEYVNRETLDAACEDPRAHLVLEPLRWALALSPRWVALEQVEPVLPLWEAMGERLREPGYSTWCGVLSAERFGVPQTRRRAILLASLDRDVAEPVATHRRYVAPRRRAEDTLALFEAPDPERIELPEEAHLFPWVSMAEALGWSGEVWQNADNSTDDLTYTRPAGSPAPALTARVSRWQLLETGTRQNATARAVGEPAPTLAFGNDAASHRWVEGQRRNSGPGAAREARPLDAPSFTIRSAGSGSHPSGVEWTTERPATTVVPDARVFPPGHKLNADDVRAGRGAQLRSGGGHTTDDDAPATVRVTVEEAAVLQSFPPGYPWQGTRTKQFEQVGNAIPVLLALRALEAVIS